MLKYFLFSIPIILTLSACSIRQYDTNQPFVTKNTFDHLEEIQDGKYQKISEFVGEEMYGAGAQEVLAVAHNAIAEKHLHGEAVNVSLEDVWSHALQEGLVLFNQPDKLWGKTRAEETADMIGQTTIGPWQMTIWNIRENYGPKYGVKPEWSDSKIYEYCRKHPDIQAKMIIDYIELSYDTFCTRSPYAIQRYFWLEPYVRGEIGQSHDWTKSVVAKPPVGGTWKDLTPEMKADTGFYAKQVLLGMPYTKSGMLFWLYVTGDQEKLKYTLRTWRDQPLVVIAENDTNGLELEGIHYGVTDQPGNFAIQPEDLIQYEAYPEIKAGILRCVEEVNAEASTDS